MPANASELEEAREEGLKVEFLVQPLEILGGAAPAASAAGRAVDADGAQAGDIAGGGEATLGAGDAGSAAGRVAGIRLQRCELGEPDASGRRQPVPVEGSEFELAADTVRLRRRPGARRRLRPGLRRPRSSRTARSASTATR